MNVPTVRLGTLGSLRVELDGQPVLIPGGYPTRLLLHLLLTPGRLWATDRLVDQLWVGQPPRTEAHTLHTHVSTLRKRLGTASAIIGGGRGKGYGLVLEHRDLAVRIDEVEFRRAVEEARGGRRVTDPQGQAELLREALALWRGEDAYPEGAGYELIDPHATELASLRRWAEGRLSTLEIAGPDPAIAIPRLESAHQARPDDQTVVAQLMRAYAATGRPQQATALYSRLVELLRDRSGLNPLPELVDLDRRIVQADPEVVGVGGDIGIDVRKPGGIGDTGHGGATDGEASGPERSTLRLNPPAPDPPAETLWHQVGVTADRTELFGQSKLLEAVSEQLGEGRTVTLVGPAGVGKSRVAREVCRRMGGRFDGVTLVPLAACGDGDSASVVEQVALTLGLRSLSVAAAVREITQRLGGRSLLVVLDNAEHVLDAVTDLVIGLAAASTAIEVLVTSREPLRIPGERVVAVPPLPSGTGQHSAAALFTARLREHGAVSPDGTTPEPDTGANDALARICAALDGLPLALEVAAGLAARHGLDQVAALVDSGAASNLAVRGAHPRQRTLQEAVGWSLERLTPPQQRTLAALVVFAHPVLAAEVAAVAAIPEPAAAASLMGLVERSLILVDSKGPDGPRYRPFETVRTVARGLGKAEDWAATRTAHAHWIADRVEALGRQGVTDLLQPLLADCRIALRWCLQSAEDDIGLRIVDALYADITRLNMAADLAPWLSRLATMAPTPEQRAVAGDVRNVLALAGGDLAIARAASDEVLERLRHGGERALLARALVVSALWAALAGELERAELLAAEARTLQADDWITAWLDAVEAFRLRRSGRFAEAELAAHAALEIFHDLGERRGCLLPRLTLGRLYAERGDPGAALDCIGKATEDAIELGDPLFASLGHLYAAQILYAAGDTGRARRQLIAALGRVGDNPNRLVLASALEHAAGLIALGGDPLLAARLVGFTTVYRRPGPRTPPPREQGFIPLLREALGRPTYDRQCRRGAQLSAKEATTAAIERLRDQG